MRISGKDRTRSDEGTGRGRSHALATTLAMMVALTLTTHAAAGEGFAKPAKEAKGRNAEAKGRNAQKQGAAGTAARVGEKAPDFTLTDLEGRAHTLSTYTSQGKFVVLEWFNPDCPFVRKHHLTSRSMADLEAKHRDRVVWLAVNSGAPGLQGAGLERNVKAHSEFRIAYPILLDEAGTVGRTYGAKATPHMVVITPEGVLAYHGAIDDDRSANKLGKTNYVSLALAAVMSGKPVAVRETPAYGCTVKYAPDAAPEQAGSKAESGAGAR